jgi:hypothetical protein
MGVEFSAEKNSGHALFHKETNIVPNASKTKTIWPVNSILKNIKIPLCDNGPQTELETTH